MKKKILVLLLALSSVLLFSQTYTKEIGGITYKSQDSYSDEFNSSSLVTTKWVDFDHNNWPDGRIVANTYYESPSNVQFGSPSIGAGNVLKLVTKKEKIEADNGFNNGGKKKTLLYTAACIKSLFSFQYGYYEIRAKMPNRKCDVGQAFWFWGQESLFGYREIDVFETSSYNPYIYPMQQHYGQLCNGTVYAYDYNAPDNIHAPTLTTNLATEFHTYGIDWQPSYIDYYIDDKLIQRFTILERHASNPSTCATTATVPITRIGTPMRCVINSNYGGGIEPSTSGDIFEVDYFRFYEKTPSITFVSYNSSTGVWTYFATINTPGTTFSVTGTDAGKLSNIQVTGIQNNGANISFKILPAYQSQTVNLTVAATRTITSLNTNVSSTVTSTSSTIKIGTQLPDFSFDGPKFLNGGLVINATAISSNIDSRWDIGIINSDGSVNWSNPQTQFGVNASFTNLLPNTNYRIQHGEYGSLLTWSQATKDISVYYNSDFIVNTPVWESNQLKLYATAKSNEVVSQWHIALINSDGSLSWLNEQIQYGANACFTNLQPGQSYRIVLGKYSDIPNSWTQTNKDVYVNLNAGFKCHEFDQWGNNNMKLKETNGNIELIAEALATNDIDQWYIFLADVNGNVDYSKILQGPLYGKTVTFNTGLLIGNYYMIKHGVATTGWAYYKDELRLIQLSPEKYRFTNYQIYTLPFEIGNGSINSNSPNNWDVQGTDAINGNDATFEFYLSGTTNITASTCTGTTNFDTKIEIFKSDGTRLNFFNDDAEGTCGTKSILENIQLSKGYYYIVVEGYNGAVGNFDLTMNISSSFKLAPPFPIVVSNSTVGRPNDFNVTGSDGSDISYQLALSEPTTFNIKTCDAYTNFDTKLELYKINGTPLNIYNDDACGRQSQISNIHLAEGYYNVVIDGYNGATGNFKLNLWQTTLKRDIIEKDSISALDVLSFTNNKISFYPNPAFDKINLIYEGQDKNTNIQLIDITGHTILNVKTIDRIIDVSQIPNGMYLIRIFSNNEIFTSKLNIIH